MVCVGTHIKPRTTQQKFEIPLEQIDGAQNYQVENVVPFRRRVDPSGGEIGRIKEIGRNGHIQRPLQ